MIHPFVEVIVPRARQIVFAVSILALCWLGMMAVHELGHVLGAVVTGGTVERCVLHPPLASTGLAAAFSEYASAGDAWNGCRRSPDPGSDDRSSSVSIVALSCDLVT
jgi:hypothetical protein